MSKVEMTIHRALSELKLTNAKIEKAISEITPLGIYQKEKSVNGHVEKAQFEKAATDKLKSINDLISRKSAIKTAIVASNAKTKVTVGGKEMFVADAINGKQEIVYKKQLIAHLTASYRANVQHLNQNNQVVENNCQRILEATFGKDVKSGKDDVDTVRKPYMEANTWHLCDPLSIITKVEEIENEVSTFEAEVDAVLSESNAITKIEI